MWDGCSEDAASMTSKDTSSFVLKLSSGVRIPSYVPTTEPEKKFQLIKLYRSNLFKQGSRWIKKVPTPEEFFKKPYFINQKKKLTQ